MNYLLIEEVTERLKFRLLEESDFEDWLPLFESKEPGLYLGMDSNLSPKQQCEKWFKKCFKRYKMNKGGMNVLVDKKANKMIGQCGLLTQDVNGTEFLEIGYSVLPEYWGQGFATEAAIKCKEFAFRNKLRDELISIVHIDNIASQKVALKNGMSIFKENDNCFGMPVNIYKISKSEL